MAPRSLPTLRLRMHVVTVNFGQGAAPRDIKRDGVAAQWISIAADVRRDLAANIQASGGRRDVRGSRGRCPRQDQEAGFSFAASALITWKSLSSLPAMPASVTYLPFTTTVGVLVMR